MKMKDLFFNQHSKSPQGLMRESLFGLPRCAICLERKTRETSVHPDAS